MSFEPTLECRVCGYEKESCTCDGPTCHHCGKPIKTVTAMCLSCFRFQPNSRVEISTDDAVVVKPTPDEEDVKQVQAVMKDLQQRFVSGNTVPVDRAMITHAQYETLEKFLRRLHY